MRPVSTSSWYPRAAAAPRAGRAVSRQATDVPVLAGRKVRTPGDVSSGDKCCKKKKHRWGECPRDRKEAAHVEDSGQREVRAGRAGQRQATR